MLAATLIVDARYVESFSEALLDAGALSVDVTDAAAGTRDEHPLYAEPGSVSATHWPRNRVVALFADDTAICAVMPGALCAASLPAGTRYDVDTVSDQDWVRLTQAQFTPQQISPRLWVVPTWHDIVDDAAVNIRLDPGLAFGTGTHPSTRLCLRWLDAYLRPGATVIDYGCGSGILAVAALKLGASRAQGVDIDQQALLAARHNAMQNQTAAAFYAAADDLKSQADVVLANILANPLIVLAPLLARLTLPGGHIVLSGILAPQAQEVCDAYRPWYAVDVSAAQEEWVLLSGTRRTQARA